MSKSNKKQLCFDIRDFSGEKFPFINDEVLRNQLETTFNYIIFLLDLEANYYISFIEYILLKDVIIHTASIVESILFYTIMQVARKGSNNDKKILREKAIKKDKYDSQKCIYKIDATKSFYAGIRSTSWEGVSNIIVFNDLIDIGKKIGIYGNDIREKLHNLRNERNNIHLHILDCNKMYKKEDLEYYFNITKELIHLTKIKLNSLT